MDDAKMDDGINDGIDIDVLEEKRIDNEILHRAILALVARDHRNEPRELVHNRHLDAHLLRAVVPGEGGELDAPLVVEPRGRLPVDQVVLHGWQLLRRPRVPEWNPERLVAHGPFRDPVPLHLSQHSALAGPATGAFRVPRCHRQSVRVCK